MEGLISTEQEVLSLMSHLPLLALSGTDKDIGPGSPLSVTLIILTTCIIVLYWMLLRAGTDNLQCTRRGDEDDFDQKNNNYTCNSYYKYNNEVTDSLGRESDFNFGVKLETRIISEETQKEENEFDCHENEKLYHDLSVRYVAKRAYCKGESQCDDRPNGVEKNLAKESADVLPFHSKGEIYTSLCSRIKVKDMEILVFFSRVSSHHPLKINGIPWSQMKEEWWRLHTFSLYPRDASCSSILLAQNGFVYIGNGNPDDDTVICVFCLSAAKDLGSATDIEKLHRSLNSNCPIVKGFDCQNVKIKECDGSRISYILSLLKDINKNTSLSVSSLQYEDQPLLLEADCSAAATTQDVLSQKHNNSSHQVTENNATYVVVTNFAQSLSLPGLKATQADGPMRDYEAQQLAVPAQADAVPDSVPSGKRSSGGSARRNQPRNSESSRAHTHNNTSHSNASNSSSHISRPEASRNSTSNSQEHPENSTSPSQQTASDNSEAPPSGSGNSYDKLGIITARPKRPEYAVEITRLHSFEGWPQDHHIKAEDLAQAGYFYTGYSDCARCFCCGGGLRNWEVGDDVWVEHARWFPKCAFIRQMMGQPFIDVVQELNKEKEIIPYDDVIAEMKVNGLEHAIPKEVKDKSTELERDAAVMTISDNGFRMADIVKAAEKLREAGQSLSADVIYEELEKENVPRQSAGIKTNDDSQSIRKKGNEKKDQEMFETLRGENSQLRQQSQCKICMDKEVSVVFLPCGHFISCNDCSFALKNCPVCRDNIKGVVRAYLK